MTIYTESKVAIDLRPLLGRILFEAADVFQEVAIIAPQYKLFVITSTFDKDDVEGIRVGDVIAIPELMKTPDFVLYIYRPDVIPTLVYKPGVALSSRESE